MQVEQYKAETCESCAHLQFSQADVAVSAGACMLK